MVLPWRRFCTSTLLLLRFVCPVTQPGSGLACGLHNKRAPACLAPLPRAADGSLGDMLFFHTYKNPGLILDIVQVRVPSSFLPAGAGAVRSSFAGLDLITMLLNWLARFD